MNLSLNCKLICAAQVSYAISSDTNGAAVQAIPNNADDPAFQPQYAALNVQTTPYIVSKDSNAVFICATDSEIIIAFRGTLSSKSLLTIEDIIVDLEAIPESNEFLPGKVHSGFLKAVTDLSDGIFQAVSALNENLNLPVYITGHSKGGGMAPIAAMYFLNGYSLNVANCVTIAGPNPGNTDFAADFNSSFPETIAFQNYLDLVPLLPPSSAIAGTMAALPLSTEFKLALVAEALLWDYSGVGNVNYIDENANLAAVPSDAERVDAIAAAWSSPGAPVIQAHHASCGFRYMENLCASTGICVIQRIQPS